MSVNDKKATLKRSRSDSPESPPANRRKSSFITAEYSGKKWPIRRNTSYSHTINWVRASFDDLEGLENENIKLYSAREGCNDGVEIAEEVWSELAPCLSTIKVVRNPPLPQIVDPKPSKRHCPEPIITVTLHPLTYDGGFSMVADSTLTIRCLESIIRKRFPHIPDIQLVFDGRRMKGGTLASCGVEDGDEIDIMSDRMGGGPVIRLFTTSPIVDLRVQLSIVKTWPVAVNYPPTMATSPSDDSLGEMIYWIVNPSHDRPSFDRSTNREVTYLSWAARADPKPRISPPSTPFPELVPYNSDLPTVLPSNSVLLAFEKVPGYIDDALLAMGLDSSTRMHFIGYWFMNLSEHLHIALRFLPQDRYEASAPLHITPAPDVTTRVFMVFMGVAEGNLGAWQAANVPAEEWCRIVGIDTTRVQDTSLFRVLEWGGMEIQPGIR